jgi:hypothetical protein
MKKSTLLYLLVVVLGLLSLLLTVSSAMLWLVFPRGFYAVRVLWADIHKWGGLALGVGVLIHVLLHWKWLLRKTRRYLGLGSRPGARAATGKRERAAQPEPN